jgi:septal ring factor EnvC (AmiA/AmiB activator)
MDFSNLIPKARELVPESLREPFEKKFLDPLRRDHRNQQIREQERIPGEIEQIQKELDKLSAKRAEADAKVARSERMLAVAQQHLKEEKAEQERIRWTAFELRGRIDSLKARQAHHGSPLLTEFIWDFSKRWDELRNSIRVEEREGRKHFLTGKVTKHLFSNVDAVNKAVGYIRSAMAQAEAMKSLPLSDEEIQIRLDELRKNIPDAHGWEQVDASPAPFIEKPYERYAEGKESR